MFSTLLRNPATWPTDIEEFTISSKTSIFMVFDDSASIDYARPSLNWMQTNILKHTLLSFYNNDESLYNIRVAIHNASALVSPYWDERSFLENIMYRDMNNYINILFQDEAKSAYHDGNISNLTQIQLDNINTDLTNFISYLSELDNKKYRGILLSIDSGQFDSSTYGELINRIFNGISPFTGSPNKNLNDYHHSECLTFKHNLNFDSSWAQPDNHHIGGIYYYGQLMQRFKFLNIPVVAGLITFLFSISSIVFILYKLGDDYYSVGSGSGSTVHINGDSTIGIGLFYYIHKPLFSGTWSAYIPINLTTENTVISI